MISRLSARSRPIRTALVTGATGLIGFRLVERLVQGSVRVRALVRPGSSSAHLERLGTEVVRCDLREPSGLSAAVKDVDTVYHCGAVTGPAHLPADVYWDVNYGGTAKILDACTSASRLECFVHLSTLAVVGFVPPGVVADEDAPMNPVDVYGMTKLLAEREAREAVHKGLPVVIARLMWTYGPRSRGAIKLFRMIFRGHLVMVGSGQNTIQPIWLEDAIDALLLCSQQPVTMGTVYNLAGPRALTTGDLCQIVAKATGGSIPPLRVPMSVARAAAWLCERTFPLLAVAPPIDHHKINFFRINHAYSVDRAAADLGWSPKTSFDEGSLMMAAWMREHGLL